MLHYILTVSLPRGIDIDLDSESRPYFSVFGRCAGERASRWRGDKPED